MKIKYLLVAFGLILWIKSSQLHCVEYVRGGGSNGQQVSVDNTTSTSIAANTVFTNALSNAVNNTAGDIAKQLTQGSEKHTTKTITIDGKNYIIDLTVTKDLDGNVKYISFVNESPSATSDEGDNEEDDRSADESETASGSSTDGNDEIHGGAGDGTTDGGKGANHLYGGAGNDRIDGGEGNDRIDGGEGNDIIYGGKGDDIVRGGEGNDRIDGGEGNDIIYGGAGNDRIDGGKGNDTIILGGINNGFDTIILGTGNDVIDVSEGASGNARVTGFYSGNSIKIPSNIKQTIKQDGKNTVITIGSGAKKQTITLQNVDSANLTTTNKNGETYLKLTSPQISKRLKK